MHRFFLAALLVGLSAGYLGPHDDDVNKSILSASEWLMSIRATESGNQGWSDNARAMLALGVAEPDWIDHPSQDLLLGLMDYKTELLVNLNNKSYYYTPGRLALNALAMQAVCLNPTNFYGHNLIQLLLTGDKPRYTFDNALVTLAICSVRQNPPQNFVDQLITYVKGENYQPGFMGDTLALTVVALKCLQEQQPSSDAFTSIQKAVQILIQSHQSDGSFGNLWTSVLVVQALANTTQDNEAQATLPFLLSHQNPQDGSFSGTGTAGDLFSTTETMMALDALRGGQGYLSPRHRVCNNISPTKTPSTTTMSSPQGKVFYQTRVGDQNYQAKDLSLTLPNGITAFDVMVQAGKVNCKDFCFKYQTYPSLGHYITEIGGVAQNLTTNQYWFVYYQVPGKANLTFSPVGVDFLHIFDGYSLVMWYRTYEE